MALKQNLNHIMTQNASTETQNNYIILAGTAHTYSVITATAHVHVHMNRVVYNVCSLMCECRSGSDEAEYKQSKKSPAVEAVCLRVP